MSPLVPLPPLELWNSVLPVGYSTKALRAYLRSPLPDFANRQPLAFADGNGRTGRLWQSLMLRQWNNIFAWISVETLVHHNQHDYYQAIQRSNLAGNSTQFIAFMLTMIRDVLLELRRAQMIEDVVTNEERLIELIKRDSTCTAQSLATSLNITLRQIQRIIAKLKADKRLIRHGATKNGYWEVVDME